MKKDYIECINDDCPEPYGVMKLINEPLPAEHLVDISDGEFNMIHPLSERVSGDLLGCSVHAELAGYSGYTGPGMYMVKDGSLIMV